MSVVFALATPPAKSAICVFRVSGDGCHKSLKKIFSRESCGFNRFYFVFLKNHESFQLMFYLHPLVGN